MASVVGLTRFLLGKNVINNGRGGSIKFYSTAPQYENIKIEVVGEKKNVGLIQLHRPKALNALCKPLFQELGKAVKDFDADKEIAAIIITGNEKAFAAGADIKEMQNNTYSSNTREGFLKEWEDVSNCGKPVIAAVNGFALGGGCELAMLCDIIYAGENAKFGQPEINIGTIPGAGGTQRLPRYVGKSKAMEIVLTGNFFGAHEAEKMGLVSKVFPVEKLLEETIKLAERIGTHSPLIVKMAKQSVNQAYETTLKTGLQFEKSLFYGTFATGDRQEGMNAFIEKRTPVYKNN
ncbi:probable enoyl-CoA hydratase, mitochondrial [Pieris rapae]|uniref:probable enoyl-CoA hydratase, mitochondrial n=1 Tax=Pieris rapae TaxID=64459 RepID=UPI001E27B6ED|nr:probable enoyl-CoA hydratase, mitochondrial [Pieris rapae]XP_045487785.1 probable enoyl-CoA hydratase, mitochondrial [Pieris rapae]